MQSKFRSRLVTSSAAILAVLLSVGVMGYRSITGLIADTESVEHTYIVISSLSETLGLLQDVQGGQRGYVITGQESYLDLYKAALPQLEKSLEKLHGLTADNPVQQRELARLKEDIESRVLLAQTVIATRRQQGFRAAQKIVLTGEGKREMDIIRASVARMEAHERELLGQRNNKAQRSSQFVLLASTGGLLVAVSIIFLILNLVRKESLRRIEVEDGLEATNLQLQDSLLTMENLTREMTILATFAEMLQSCRTEDEACHVIKRTLPQAFPQASVTLGLINASQNLVEIVLNTAANGPVTNPFFSPDACWCLRRGHQHLVQNESVNLPCPHLESDANGDRANSDNESAKELPGSMMCVPLMAHGETLGVLTITENEINSFSEADQRIASSIAEHASLAIANLKLQETLRTQSIRDPLSGLFNRRYLEVSLDRELARARRNEHPLCVIMIDIDFFKKFNDKFGHEAGDLLLKEFGEFLQRHSRVEDIACRYGGEEFTLILPEASLEIAFKRAEQLREETSRLKIEYRREFLPGITISAGIAAFPAHSTTKEDLMRIADTALYRAKKEGRDRVIVADLPLEA